MQISDKIDKQHCLKCIAEVKSCIAKKFGKFLMRFRHRFPNEYKLMLEECKRLEVEFFNRKVTIHELVYILENNVALDDSLICPVCKKNKRRFYLNVGYIKTCSGICTRRDPELLARIKQTRLANHGGKYVDEKTLKKTRATCMERYGVSSFSKTVEYTKKVQDTKLARYGDKNYNNSQKTLDTKEARYGIRGYNNIEKIRQTFHKRYGENVNAPVQIPEVQARQRQTCFEKYGVRSYLQSKECSEASRYNSYYNVMLKNEFDAPVFTFEEYCQRKDLLAPLKFKCNKCGEVFLAQHNNGFHSRCPTCYPHVQSTGQTELYQFLLDLLPNEFIQQNTRKVLEDEKELDIYIPSKKLAIEYDGLYWHSVTIKSECNYHLLKTEQCEDKDIQLIHIFENEWLSKQNIVKSRLKNLLGIYDKTLFARKCEVKEVDSKTSKAFQTNNHIQGAINSKVNIGLYFNDELISLMTFGKTRFSKKYEWEMLRFCNKLGYHIPGAAGKLLKHFEKAYNPKSLVSYADRRWSTGKLYKSLGFILDHKSPPNYWYWRSGYALESRTKYQKHKLNKLLEKFDESKTEIQNMEDNGYKRIFDCGNLVFVKEYK